MNKYYADPNTIILDLNSKHPIFADIEVYLGGVGRISFEDDTVQFVDEEGNIFSPRLPEEELAEFCKVNLSRYEAFHDANEILMDQGQTLPMMPFW